MLRPLFFFWLLLLFDPPAVSADRHINIVLLPKGYKDPRTLDNFTCGIDIEIDAGRLLAEQNSNYILETFLDNKETDPEYQAKVFDVLTFSRDGTPQDMIKNQLCPPDMDESGLYSLLLIPPKAQCNTRTFEDAVDASGVGYYPVFIGTTGNFSEIISKFTSSSDTFKQFYSGDVPKLCGTKLKMRPKAANARKDTIVQMFNLLYNSVTARTLDPTKEKSCWSSDETLDAIVKSDLFDLSSKAKFEQSESGGPESDGLARVMIERDATDRKALVFVKTEFPPTGGIVKPAGPHDIVGFNGPVIFNQGSNETEVIIIIKTDNDEEDPEAFKLVLQEIAEMKSKKRNKRSSSRSKSVPAPSSRNQDQVQGPASRSSLTFIIDLDKTKTPDGLENCKLWKTFAEESGKIKDPAVPTAQRDASLTKMTTSIMKLIDSFAEADSPTNQFQMYRKTSWGAAVGVYSVFHSKVRRTKEDEYKETWFSTSLNHPRLFLNEDRKKERPDTVMMVYHLDVNKFKSFFNNRIILSKDAGGFPDKEDHKSLKNYVHRELLEEDREREKKKVITPARKASSTELLEEILEEDKAKEPGETPARQISRRELLEELLKIAKKTEEENTTPAKKASINHPWTKFNFALRGTRNHEMFNKCIEKVEVCNVLLEEANKRTQKRDEIGTCYSLAIGVGLKMAKEAKPTDLGPDGYYDEKIKKSVTSKHKQDQPQDKYNENCDVAPEQLDNKDQNMDDEEPLFDLFEEDM